MTDDDTGWISWDEYIALMEKDERLGLPSASVMRRVDQCTGSEALIATLRAHGKIDDRPSADAVSGRTIHAMLATPKSAIFDQPITDSEIHIAKLCLDIKDKLLVEWVGNVTDTFFVVTEQRLFYRRSEDGKPIFSGQPDFVAIDFKNLRAFVINYKTGRKQAQHASDNLQLRTEVVLVKHAYNELKEIDAAIVEPNVDWEPVRVRYTEYDIADAEAQLRMIVSNARTQADVRHAGDWCTYCPARVYCPEARSLAVSVTEYQPVTISQLPRGHEGTEFFEKLKIAKKLIDRYEQAYTELLEDEPLALPGYILPEKGPLHWVVPHPTQFREAFEDHLTYNEIDGALTWNIGKLRELFGMKHRLKGDALFKKFHEVAGDSVKRLHSQPYIRPLTKKEKQLLLNQNIIQLEVSDDEPNKPIEHE